jgi:hypothetical protein
MIFDSTQNLSRHDAKHAILTSSNLAAFARDKQTRLCFSFLTILKSSRISPACLTAGRDFELRNRIFVFIPSPFGRG